MSHGKTEAWVEVAPNVKQFKEIVIRDFVGGANNATTSREHNVAGLASAIALANELRTDIINHFGNETRHTTAPQPTTTIGAVATDIATLVTLTTSLGVLYALHNVDAVKASAWVYHDAQATASALVNATAPTNLQTSITKLNDIKAKYNAHEVLTTGHATQGSVTADLTASADAAYGTANLVPVTGAASGDFVFWSILEDGSGSAVGVSAVATTDGVTFTFSADPQNDAIVSYMVIRPKA